MNLCELKNKSELIPRGKIPPNWFIKIINGDKKGKHRVVSGGVYVFRHNGFMYWFKQEDKQDYGLKVSDFKNTDFKFNPYGKKEARFLNGESLDNFIKGL